MALKFFPRRSTSLQAFLREYNLSLSFCTHPSLTRALGIFFSTPGHYVFAQQAGLYGDLYNVIVSEVSGFSRLYHLNTEYKNKMSRYFYLLNISISTLMDGSKLEHK